MKGIVIMNIYLLDALVFGYKFTRQQWTCLCTIWGEDYIYSELEDDIYEFQDYVIVGHAVITNTDDSKGIAYDLQSINEKLLNDKQEIDTTTTKILNFISNFPNKPLPQIYYIHLATE